MSREDLPPRNYFPLAVSQVERLGFDQSHDQLRSALRTGAMELEIEVLTPVHVGSGAFGLADGQMAKMPLHRDGQPVVPGTSIKGMCRQIHEVLTQSASPFDKDPPQKGVQPSASAALFGRLGYQARVSFDDAVPTQPVKLQVVRLSVGYPPQNDVGRRFYGPMPEGADQPRRIPVLALPSGTRLITVLRFRNVRDDELGAVLLSLGVDRFTPKLGGGKYDPLGWVRFRPLRYRLRRGLTFRATPWISETTRVMELCTGLVRDIPSQLPPAGRSALKHLENKMQAPACEIRGES